MKFTFAQRPEGFDNHINHSIRGYDDLCDDVIKLSQYFVEDDSNVVDIGCSTGKMLKIMIQQNTFAPKAKYVGVEIESDFYSKYDEDEKNNINLTYARSDIVDYDFYDCSYVTSIFTLQFIDKYRRSRIVKNIYNALHSGGAFVFAEKTISEYSKIHEIRTSIYYDYKRKYFDYDDIMTKEQKLRYMQKPMSGDEIIEMCNSAGFDKVDTFWQNHAFIGFIAIK